MYYIYWAQIEIALCSFCFHSHQHKSGINPVTKPFLHEKIEKVVNECVAELNVNFLVSQHLCFSI